MQTIILIVFLLFSVSSHSQQTCIITKIVDGDTFDCSINDKTERIRLIGVNTPEKNTEQGKQAAKFAEELIPIDSKVSLELDVQEYGPFKRLLAYVYLPSGKMFNQLLVEEGFAQVATYPPNVKYVNKFIEAEKSARENKKGFWK